ncbi:15262_t:CDS:2 [Gigaspora rosea]|nr:15262_t:CDS:2 [Gigaspora rosea]
MYEMYNELPSIKTRFRRNDRNDSLIIPTTCDEYILATTYIPEPDFTYGPYYSAFLPSNNIASIFTLEIYITDPRYSNLQQNFSMAILAYDKEYDPSSKFYNPNDKQTQFDLEIYLKNAYYLTQPSNDILIYIMQFTKNIRFTMIQDIFSYIGLTPKYDQHPYLESSIQSVPKPNQPGFAWVQFSSLPAMVIREEIEQSLLPFVEDLQPDRHDTDKNVNSLTQQNIDDLKKKANRLENFNSFYEEYVIGASLLDFVEEDSSRVHEDDSSISILNNNESDNMNENE